MAIQGRGEKTASLDSEIRAAEELRGQSQLDDVDQPRSVVVRQEAKNLEQIAVYRGYGFEQAATPEYIEVTLMLDGTGEKGTITSCGT